MPANVRERAKAWIYAAINPWIDALTFENTVLQNGSVSYRWRRQDFEHLRPIKHHLLRGADLIVADLIRYRDPGRVPAPFRDFPGEWQSQHDQQLDRLRSAAREAFKELSARPGLTEELERAAAETPETARRAESRELAQYLPQLVERILNRIEDLGHDYSDADFWNQHRARFMKYRDGPSVTLMDSESEKLKALNEDHIRKLAVLRNELVDEFDIPPALVG